MVDYVVSVSALDRLIVLDQRKKAVSDLARWRLGLRCCTAKQLSTAIHDPVIIAIQHEPRIIAVCRRPRRVNLRAVAKNIKVDSTSNVGEAEPVTLYVDHDRCRAKTLEANCATICHANATRTTAMFEAISAVFLSRSSSTRVTSAS